ncbi:MAG: VapB-type antitoxin [Candidatus Asgardarchaeum sp.]
MSSTFSIRISKKLKEEMKKYSKVDWANEIRKYIQKKIRELKLEEILTKAKSLRQQMKVEINHVELIREDRER